MNNFQRHFQDLLNDPAPLPPTLQPPAIQPPVPEPLAPFQLIQGRRPTHKQLLHQGFRYVQNGGHLEKKYWRCFYHKKDSHNPLPCKSILHTYDFD